MQPDPTRDTAARRTKRPANAYEALRERGWHDQPNSVRYCRWNNVRVFVTDQGDTMLDAVKTSGNGRWIVQFAADVPFRIIVAAAETAAGRPTDGI